MLCVLVFCTYARVTSQCACLSDPAPVTFQQPVQVVAPAPAFVARRPAPVVFSSPAPACGVCTPAYKTVAETVMQEQEITTYETVWDEETRYATKVVARQVPETSVRTETVKVQKPVWETVEKETSYDVVRYVPETSEREEVQTVKRPVCEVQEREIVETVKRPVQQTILQQRQYTVNRAVTSCQTQIRDEGRFVTRYTPEAPREFRRLTWQRGGEYFDPATGTTKTRLPGLYWTQLQSAPQFRAQQVYEQNLVARQVPVTSFVPETIVENVPVNVTTFQEEQIVRKEQVPVTRYVEEQLVKKIPVTTYKPVTERVVQKTPVKVCRIQTEEQVRQIPVTTYKTVREEIKEPYKVRIARTVPKTVKVQRPVTVYKQVPVEPVISPCDTTISTTISEPARSTPAPQPTSEPSRTPDASAAPSLSTEPVTTSGIDSRVTTTPMPGPAKTLEKTVTSSPQVLPAIPTPVPDTSAMFASDKPQKSTEAHTSTAKPVTEAARPIAETVKTDSSTASVATPSAASTAADTIPPISIPKSDVADTAPSLPAETKADQEIRSVNHVEAKAAEPVPTGTKAPQAKVEEEKTSLPAASDAGNDQFLKLQRPASTDKSADRFDTAKPEEIPVKRPMPTVSPTRIFTD